jgi:hypothetical protein
MSQGLKIFNAASQVILDIQDNLLRAYGTYTVNAVDFGAQSGFVSVPGMARDGRWLVISGASSATYSYFFCTAQSGGFNWIHSGFDQSASCTITVFKL